MNAYLLIKTVHIIIATVLFGTELGIAFFMFRSRYTGCLREKFFAIRTTVLADYIFTAPAAMLQPATGAWLIWDAGRLAAGQLRFVCGRRGVLAAGCRDTNSSQEDRR